MQFRSNNIILQGDSHRLKFVMNEIFERVQPQKYWYGHFHNTMQQEYKGCQFRCLGINELKEFNSS